jgi:hypothetical protein
MVCLAAFFEKFKTRFSMGKSVFFCKINVEFVISVKKFNLFNSKNFLSKLDRRGVALRGQAVLQATRWTFLKHNKKTTEKIIIGILWYRHVIYSLYYISWISTNKHNDMATWSSYVQSILCRFLYKWKNHHPILYLLLMDKKTTLFHYLNSMLK